MVYTEKNSLYSCTRNQLFCLVRTGANFAILVEMTNFKFSKKNKESKLIDGQILSGACIRHNQKTTLRLWSTRAKFILIKVGLKELLTKINFSLHSEKVINTEDILFTAEFCKNSIAILIEFNC